MQAELRRRHRQMCKLVEFVHVEGWPKLEQSLPEVIRHGWDGMQFQRNYNLLHYAAECVDDPDVVELVAVLAPNVDERDDEGNTPLDYARPGPLCIINAVVFFHLVFLSPSSCHLFSSSCGSDLIPVFVSSLSSLLLFCFVFFFFFFFFFFCWRLLRAPCLFIVLSVLLTWRSWFFPSLGKGRPSLPAFLSVQFLVLFPDCCFSSSCSSSSSSRILFLCGPCCEAFLSVWLRVLSLSYRKISKNITRKKKGNSFLLGCVMSSA